MKKILREVLALIITILGSCFLLFGLASLSFGLLGVSYVGLGGITLHMSLFLWRGKKLVWSSRIFIGLIVAGFALLPLLLFTLGAIADGMGVCSKEDFFAGGTGCRILMPALMELPEPIVILTALGALAIFRQIDSSSSKS